MYISLVFFPGCHFASDQFPGPTAIIRSLKGQFLHQYTPGTRSGEYVFLSRVGKGDIKLSTILARQTPQPSP
jgi:hypothetical protein